MLFLPQLDAIQKFLDGCREYGMKQDDLFTTLDLFEETDRNMVSSVVGGLCTAATTLSDNELPQTTIRFAIHNKGRQLSDVNHERLCRKWLLYKYCVEKCVTMHTHTLTCTPTH